MFSRYSGTASLFQYHSESQYCLVGTVVLHQMLDHGLLERIVMGNREEKFESPLWWLGVWM